MKTILAALGLGIVTATGAVASDQVWSGMISDSMCGLKHTMSQPGKAMSDRDCTQFCAGHGASYALVSEGKVYRLKNREGDLKSHAGHLVNLTGESSGATIRVSKVEMPAPKS